VNERFTLVDLPGYGFAVGPETERLSWGPLVEGYLRARPTLRGVLLVVDVRRELEEEERELLAFLRATGRPAAAAVTKLDKFRRGAAYARVAAIRRELAIPVVGFSSRLGTGRAELWKVLRGWLDETPDVGHNEPDA
jgi:GTP-binding protein